MVLKGVWHGAYSPINGGFLVPSPQTQMLDPEFATSLIRGEMWFWGMIGRPDSSSPVQVALVSWLSIKVIMDLFTRDGHLLSRMPAHDHSDHSNRGVPKW